jgi:hypothetical protein
LLERDSILIYRSFYEAGKKSLNDEQFGKYIKLIFNYGFYGEEIKDTGDPIIDALTTIIKPLLDANSRNYENAKKGGAPKGNQNARKKTTQNNQKQPPVDSTQNNQNNQKQPNVNVNVNSNVNANLNEKENENNMPPAASSSPWWEEDDEKEEMTEEEWRKLGYE